MNSEPLLWEAPPGKLTLDRREVHVWRGRLDLQAETLARLWAVLSPDEQDRAKRFCFARDRDAFIAARGMLRGILGRYLDLSADALRFDYSVHGKPSLPGELGGDRVRFNLSHSHELTLCAVACRRQVGIDLEYQRPELADESIAERFFSAGEITTLRSLPSSLQREAFFACWTRKEAYMKAVGSGLMIPLDRVEVTLAPEEPAALLSTEGGPADAGRWSLRELEPGAGYAAALVVEGHDWQLRCWDWIEPLAPG